MSEYQSKVFKTFIKGISAVSDRYGQPPGSVPRGSNLIMTKRGALVTCDGTKLIHAFNGVPSPNRGKIMSGLFFSPTGVSSYYLIIAKILEPLGPPQNLTLVTAAGGTLAAATYFYKVTALDGAGGETTASAEASIVTGANGKNTLTWNIVPNASKYNIYRSTASGTETLLFASNLPASQVQFGALTVSYIDDGTSTTGPSAIILGVSRGSTSTSEVVIILQAPGITGLVLGQTVQLAGVVNPLFDVAGPVDLVVSPTKFNIINHFAPLNTSSTGGVASVPSIITPPLIDNTQQTALYQMPIIIGSPATLPTPYDDTDIVAFYPADIGPAGRVSIDGGGGGGSGGGGGTGGGGSTGGGSTPSGGIPGNVSFIPEMLQFANRAILALGNGFPGQVFSDPLTPTNPATVSTISAISVDAFGVVTVTVIGGHGIPAAAVGGNVVLDQVGNAVYDGTYPTIQIVSATVFKVRNLGAIGSGASAGGTVTTTSLPIISTFTQGFPVWATGVTYLVGDLITPVAPNGHYYKCIQGGISAAAAPAFPLVTGAQVPESSPSQVIWQEAGLTNTTAPPPQGMAHIKVYAGSLWAWNTAPFNTLNGLDGPTCLRMSDSNNPNSWNPINQAFLDKDDGTEGSGIHAFTISGFGIPPEGSLVAFKQYAGYQIVGVFGSQNFLIQRIKSSLGCIAPRTIQFTTGFGLTRFSHLGFAVFDGMNDRIVDEDIHPYIFPANEIDFNDITTVDFNWMSISWATQTSYPAMYIAAFPIGNSGGQLTRLFCYDLVLKSWVIVDLPFAIGTVFEAFSDIAVPVTILATFDDGCLHRWQAGDDMWAPYLNNISHALVPPSKVNWELESPTVYNERSQGGRIYCRQLVIRAKITDPDVVVNVALELQGEPAVNVLSKQVNLGTDGTIAVNTAISEKVTNLDAIISGSGAIEINSLDFQIKPEIATVPAVLT
jgi:uncharacterized membrane protein YgcG